jgi:Uma2 family endonuclease
MLHESPPLLTPARYLEFERRADVRSEYFAGETFAMAGGSQRRNLIVANLVRLLGNQLAERDCNVYPSDMRLKIEALGKYTYPDVSVACGENRFEDEQRDVLLNPVILFEVLSESTEAYDRGRKFEHYQRIESLAQYVLVAQDSCRVESFVRRERNEWTYTELHSPEAVLRLEPIACELPLAGVYLKVDLG